MRRSWADSQVGARFGMLTVESVDRSKPGTPLLVALCDCGKRKSFDSSNVRRGLSKSCGCNIGAAVRLKATKHGHCSKAEYSVWFGMLKRCENTQHPSYRHYGGRGIKVCDRWKIFENFLADMGPRPSPKHSIDRRDNAGHYEPGNCRWATRREQMNNTRAVHYLEFQGRKQSITEWSRETGLSLRALNNRIRRGWPVERALTQRVSRRIQLRNEQLYGESLA